MSFFNNIFFSGKAYGDSKRRGRTKKSLDILRGGADTTPSPGTGMDGFPPEGMHPGFPFHHDIRLRPPSMPDFGERMSPGTGGGMPEFYPDGWQGGDYMSGYGGHIPPPADFRPGGFCDINGGGNMSEQERALVIERMGIPSAAHMAAAAAAAAQQQRHNGFYRGEATAGGFPGQEAGYPHSPILPHEFTNPATQSPNPHSFPSPDHHVQHQTGVGSQSQREAMISPSAQHQNGGFFNVAAASTVGMPAPDSPAPGSSSSSSGSILERALAKQEPPSPHMPGTGTVSSTPPSSMSGSVVTTNGQDWSAGGHQVFPDVNVDEYIKQHDFGGVASMEGMVEYQGYAAAAAAAAAQHHHHHQHAVQAGVGGVSGPGVGDQQHAAEQYHHQQYAHHTAVSVGPPWVR